MTAQELITRFELQVSDITELSTSEELAILNRVYRKIWIDRPWEFAKKSASGVVLQDADGYYLLLPSDFAYFAINGNYTDNSIGDYSNSQNSIIFTGASNTPITLVNYSDRAQYRGRTGYAYLDYANGRVWFPNIAVGTTYQFDYVSFPTDLGLNDSPRFPSTFHETIVFGMAVENEIIQLSPKASSYAPENQAKYQSGIADIAFWNSQLLMN